ncbi:TPA: hypothetical protein RTG57_001741 [Campylobacter jejuni]|nr:hypothetical protein [Campylobacter jejuni]HDZ5057813.1 hypothetical protein [Campylobacter jejuni]
MSNKKMIDGNYNFVIPLENSRGDTLEVFLPFIPKINVDRVAPVLGLIFDKLQKGLNPDVFIVDNASIIDELIQSNYDENKIHKIKLDLEAFIERSLLTAVILKPNGQFVDYPALTDDDDFWDNSCYDSLKGFLLFILALWRYMPVKRKTTLLGHFIVCLSLSEWKSSLKKSSPEQNIQDENTSEQSTAFSKKQLFDKKKRMSIDISSTKI